MTDHDLLNPVVLLRDGKGVYGIGLSDEYLQAREGRCENIKLILRPDRIDEAILRPYRIGEAYGRDYPACLQGLPPWSLPREQGVFRVRRLFKSTQEGILRDKMIAVARSHAGISESIIPHSHDANRRRHYFGLPIMATRMFNAMMRQVTDSADPEALRVARRFPLAMRWPIYSTGVRSQRVLQLAEAFPLLAYRIHFLLTSQENEKGELTIRMIERGAKLRDIAAVWGFPMRLRRIKPAAVFLVSGVLLLRPELLDHMPEALPKMRRWLRAVGAADARLPDYALWVARNWASIDGFQEIENFADWVRANRQIERQFVPSMSVRTVRQLSAEWHEAIARAAETESGPFPQPWFPAGRLSSGEEIVPITNSVDLLREGQAMHHCVASYSRCVIAGQQYIYSIRKSDQRIATLALTRDELGKATLGQIRGACNAAVPAKIMTTVRRWLASQQSGVPEASPQQ